jgi:hypothetical protein
MSWGDSYACPCSNCGGNVEYRNGLCRSCYSDAEEDRRQERIDSDYERWRDGDD